MRELRASGSAGAGETASPPARRAGGDNPRGIPPSNVKLQPGQHHVAAGLRIVSQYFPSLMKSRASRGKPTRMK